jgi:TRAP-type C4-dicarboxylate transport system permease small subunit
MHATATVHAPVTPMALETIVAVVLVAVLVTIGIAVVYALVAGSLAWVLMLVVGVLRLVWLMVRGAARGVRARLHRAPDRIRQITPETVPDLRVRPLG